MNRWRRGILTGFVAAGCVPAASPPRSSTVSGPAWTAAAPAPNTSRGRALVVADWVVRRLCPLVLTAARRTDDAERFATLRPLVDGVYALHEPRPSASCGSGASSVA